MTAWHLRASAAVLAAVVVTSNTQAPVVVDRNVEARMRDDVILRADVYRPAAGGRHPVLLQRTPYSKNGSGASAELTAMAARGFVVISQDTRGRYTSDGAARPHDEAEDGFDTIAWARSLPYANGRVGMWGGSYLATTQLLAATTRPGGLVALFPASSYSSRYDMVFQGGAFYLADGLSWNLGQAMDVRRRVLTPGVDRDGPIGLDDASRRALNAEWLWHVPLKSINAMELQRFAPGYRLMLDHPGFDAFWETFDIEARHDRFEAPAYHLTGWYDTLLTGTLRNFTGLRARAASETARRHQRIIVGPWTHARPTPFYLHSAGGATTLRGDGVLSRAAPADEPPDFFVYDPSNPVPTGAAGGYSRRPTDQREIEQRPDVLVYTSAPLESDLEVTGPLSLALWIASSARDTDFTGKLVDVVPDGTARAINDGILRVRYRRSRTSPELLVPGEPTEITIDLGATSNLFRAGHRIRLEVSSSNFPRFDRNPNTGGVFGEDAELRRADQTVFHDRARPSRLVLPVIPR